MINNIIMLLARLQERTSRFKNQQGLKVEIKLLNSLKINHQIMCDFKTKSNNSINNKHQIILLKTTSYPSIHYHRIT